MLFTTVISATRIEEGNKANQKNRSSCITHHYTRKSQWLLLVTQAPSVLCPLNCPCHLRIASCILVCCSLALETAQVCVCSVYFNLLNTSTLPSTGSAQCSRFRKITRGEWLTQSSCCVTKGSYQITARRRLGETVAGFRSLWLEQTRNWD